MDDFFFGLGRGHEIHWAERVVSESEFPVIRQSKILLNYFYPPMRLPRSIGMLLVFSGCLSIPLPGGRSVPVSVVTGAAAIGLEEQIRAALRAAKQRLAGGVKKLQPAECGARTCYSAQDVTKLVDAARAGLNKDIPKEAEALRATVEAEIDAEMSRLQPRAAAGDIRLVTLQPVTAAGYDAASVNSVIDHIVAVIDRILSYDKLALPLMVNSKPAKAHFEMLIRATQQRSPYELDTNNRLPSVWRGIYTGIAHKTGYKDGTAYIDLINGGPTRVTCTLELNGSAEESTCHVE